MNAYHRIFLALVALLPVIAVAQSPQVTIFSLTDSSCTAWAKSSGNKLIRAQYELWMRGFASGQNFGNPKLQVPAGKFPASDVLYQYLDQYCSENPNSSFIAGTIHLVEQIRQPTAPAKTAPAKKEAVKAAPAATKAEPAKISPAAK